jgi:putative endonuclease
MFYVYVLWSASFRQTYVGSTQDAAERLRRHNAGHSRSTRRGLPWVLIHTETFPTRAEAVQQERYFKTGRGREELNRILAQRV